MNVCDGSGSENLEVKQEPMDSDKLLSEKLNPLDSDKLLSENLEVKQELVDIDKVLSDNFEVKQEPGNIAPESEAHEPIASRDTLIAIDTHLGNVITQSGKLEGCHKFLYDA